MRSFILIVLALLLRPMAYGNSTSDQKRVDEIFKKFLDNLTQYLHEIHGLKDYQDQMYFYIGEEEAKGIKFSKDDEKKLMAVATESGKKYLQNIINNKQVSKVRSFQLKEDIEISRSEQIIKELTMPDEFKDTLDCSIKTNLGIGEKIKISKDDIFKISNVKYYSYYAEDDRKEGFELVLANNQESEKLKKVQSILCFQWGYGESAGVKPNGPSLSGDLESGEVKRIFQECFSNIKL